jgi:hypothetical protein
MVNYPSLTKGDFPLAELKWYNVSIEGLRKPMTKGITEHA